MTRQAQIERLARFMGWRLVKKAMRPRGKPDRHGYQWHDAEGNNLGTNGGGFHGWGWSASPPPITSIFSPFTRIDDSMMVAERMIARDCDFKLWNHDLGFGCRIGTLGCDAKDGHGKTPSEAVTLAALAYLDAVGFE